MPEPPSPPPDPRHVFGRHGEHQAREWLEARGWHVLAERFRVGRNEIDLIVRRGTVVAFVEVKARRGAGFGPGREAVGWRKQRAISRVAEIWRLRQGQPGDCYRFDVIEVVRATGVNRLVHIEDAWRLTYR